MVNPDTKPTPKSKPKRRQTSANKKSRLTVGFLIGLSIFTLVIIGVFIAFHTSLQQSGFLWPMYGLMVLLIAVTTVVMVYTLFPDTLALYEGKVPYIDGEVKLSGPAALLLVLIAFMAYQFRPAPAAFNVTLMIKDHATKDYPEGLAGDVMVEFPGDPQTEDILTQGDNRGLVRFTNLPPKWWHETVSIRVRFKGFSSAQNHTEDIELNQASITIKVNLTQDLLLIGQVVDDENNKPLAGVTISVSGQTGSYTTDSLGNIRQPVKKGMEQQDVRVRFSKPGYRSEDRLMPLLLQSDVEGGASVFAISMKKE